MKSIPPWTVLAAVGISIVSFSLSLIIAVRIGTWENPMAPWLFLIPVGLMSFYLCAIYNGRNWARIALLVVTVMSVFAVPNALQRIHSSSDNVKYLIQWGSGVITAILVYLPPSNRWYSRHKNKAAEQGAAANP